MKIGIILSHCHSYGSSRYVIETVKYFIKKGHEVHIFANTCDKIDDKKVFFHKIPQPFKSSLLLRESIFTFLETLLLKFYKFDVTVAQPTRYFSPDIAEVQFVFKKGIERRKNIGVYFKIINKILSLIEEYNLKKAKRIIAISKSVKNELIKYYNISKEKVYVVYGGVNLKNFTPENRKKYFKEIRERHNIKPDDLLLLFVGNPFDRKGLSYVIQALPHLKHKKIKLLVIGKDNPTPYVKLAKKLEVDDKIIFNTTLTREIHKYFAVSDIFIFPTLYEPFGLVILEAMASGIPIITSKFAGAAELIENKKEGLLLNDPKNINEISKKLDYLIKSKVLRKRMGRKARKKAEKYSWKRAAEIRLKIFEEVTRV